MIMECTFMHNKFNTSDACFKNYLTQSHNLICIVNIFDQTIKLPILRMQIMNYKFYLETANFSKYRKVREK